MKKTNVYIKYLTLLFFLLLAKKNVSQCTANFSYTIGASGAVNYVSTSLGTNSTTTYFWSFGNGTSYTATGSPGIFTSNTFTANGTYFVTLFISSTFPVCTSTITQTVSISTVTLCPIIPAFSFTTGGGGNVNFQSISTGTILGTNYTWKFGDGSIVTTSNTTISHTYSVNSNYAVKLFVFNNSSCLDSVTNFVNVTGVPCNLLASFNYTTLSNGGVFLSSASTGTNATTSYTWAFGDSSPNSSGIALPQVSHTYGANGTYSLSLFLANTATPTCVNDTTIIITVTNSSVGCNLTANFTHTVGSSGIVTFSNTSQGTSSTTSHFWNFGDGVYSTINSPTHLYTNAGTHYVNLYINNNGVCKDSITYAINVTGVSCSANSNFNLSPTGTAQYWNATPIYPWNVTSAIWNWGDGNSSNGLYTSHTYAAA
jgi:PKD repeat protein